MNVARPGPQRLSGQAIRLERAGRPPSMLRAEALRARIRGPVWALDGINLPPCSPGPHARHLRSQRRRQGPRCSRTLAGLNPAPRPAPCRSTAAGGAIGWIGHQTHLYNHLTVRENLLFLGVAVRRGRQGSVSGAPIALLAQARSWPTGRISPCWCLSRGFGASAPTIARAFSARAPRYCCWTSRSTGTRSPPRRVISGGCSRAYAAARAFGGDRGRINVEEGAELALRGPRFPGCAAKFVEHAPRGRRGAAGDRPRRTGGAVGSCLTCLRARVGDSPRKDLVIRAAQPHGVSSRTLVFHGAGC